jgi:hypothetical protein
VHAAGIELNYAFLIGQSAQAHAVIVGIVFRTLYDAKRSVEGIAAAMKEVVGIVQVVVSIRGGHDDWPLARQCSCLGSLGVLLFLFLTLQAER